MSTILTVAIFIAIPRSAFAVLIALAGRQGYAFEAAPIDQAEDRLQRSNWGVCGNLNEKAVAGTRG